MRRIFGITAAALLLVGVGVAVAHSNNKSIRSVSATFGPTTASDVKTSTCTDPSNKTYTRTSGTYNGTASSTEPSLNGPIKIDASSLINSDGDGIVEGKLRIEASDGTRTSAYFTAVHAVGGKIAGLAVGHTTSSGGQLIANFSADFSAATGFTNAKLGVTAGGNAVLITRGGCRPSESKSKPEHVEAHGKIGQVSSTSITVAGITCSVPTNLQSTVAKLTTDDYVSIKCDVVSGQTPVLTRVSGWHSKHDKHDD
jgi:hypothetical protein